MIEVVTSWKEFGEKWTGDGKRQNFLLRGEMFPFRFETPPLEEVLDAVRQDEKTRIMWGHHSDIATGAPYPELRDLPIEEAMKAKANVAHFESRRFAGPGGVFEGLNDVFDAWYDSLHAHGFTHNESSSQRAFFYSGSHCQTPYHFDSSYVLVCQVWGRKRFCWLKDPDRWCTRETLEEQADNYPLMRRPDGITRDDVIECEMHPGDVLWNVMLTPHWVYAVDEPTFSFNLTHFDLKHNGARPAISKEYALLRPERMAQLATA